MMDQSSSNDLLEEHGDADVDLSQNSSGIDVNSIDASTSSQGTVDKKEYCSTGKEKPLQVLKIPLDELRHQFQEFNLPKNHSEWWQLFESTVYKSKKRSIIYEEHLWTWLNLIYTAKEFNNDIDYEEALVNCYESAISTLPLKLFGSDTKWLSLINGLYSHIIVGDIKDSAGERALKVAEMKLKYSPVHARVYWNVVMKNEKQLMKSMGKPLAEQHLKICLIFKTKFSNPYYQMEDDYYHDFVCWSLDVNLKQDQRLEVQEIFMKSISKPEVALFSKTLEMADHERITKGYNHHLVFGDWVECLCSEESPDFDKVEVVCEEIIAEFPDSFCFYYIYLEALSSSKFKGLDKRKEKLYEIIERAYKMGKTSCIGMDKRCLEFSLIFASKVLSVGKVLELIENAMTLFSVINDLSKWYAASRGIIIAISNLVHDRKIDPSNFDKYFHRVIAPCNMDFYSSSVVPEEVKSVEHHELKLYELVKLWVECQQSFYNLSWSDTLILWTKTFFTNTNPIMLVGYVDYVRNHGSQTDAIEASRFALEQISNIEAAEGMNPNQMTQKCFIKLLQDHFEVISATGEIEAQVYFYRQLQKRMAEYLIRNRDGYLDIRPTELFLDGVSHLERLIYLSSSESEKFSQDSVIGSSRTLTSSSSDSLTNKMKSLRFESDSSETGPSKEDEVTRRAFVSNLSFEADEKDVLNAFVDKGFYPIKAELKRSANGKSLGFGFVEFNSKDAAELAISVCDKFKILDRMTFVSKFKSRPSMIKKTPKGPTLLSISNLPEEWKDEDKISNKLSCYGHIKSVTIEEHSDSTFTVKVQFHMTDDAFNAHDQIMEKKVFGDTSVSCRMGYERNKQPRVEGKNEDKKFGNKKKIQKKSSGDERRMVSVEEYNLESSQPKVKERNIEFSKVEEEDLLPSQSNVQPSQPNTNHTEKISEMIGPQMPVQGLLKEGPKLRATKGFNLIPMQVRQRDQPRITKRSHMKARLDVGAPSTSFGNESPERKIRKVEPEKEIQHHGSTRKEHEFQADEAATQELEMEEDEEQTDVTEKPSLTNKDFQRLLKRDN